MVAAAASSAAGSSGAVGPFTAPSPGIPAQQRWLEKRTQLAVDHVAGGSFQSGMSLLHRQLGVADFTPLKPYFMDLYLASHAQLPGLQGMEPMLCHLDRWAHWPAGAGWSGGGGGACGGCLGLWWLGAGGGGGEKGGSDTHTHTHMQPRWHTSVVWWGVCKL